MSKQQDRNREPLRVLLVDDHPLYVAGVRNALEQLRGVEVVGETGSGREAVRLAQDLRPDVVVLDVGLPDLSGVQVAEQILREQPEMAILVLTGHENEAAMRALMRLGVRGYLTKAVRPTELVAAVQQIAAGQTVYSQRAARALRSSAPRLTEREKVVLVHVARGNGNKAIAREMKISEKAVEGHLTRIYGKLGARSRTEAIVKANELGVIALPRTA